MSQAKRGAQAASPRIVAIVQARMGSTRLPMKSLLCLRGLPIIDWVAQRLAKSGKLHRVVFALPDTPLDDALAQHLERNGQDVVRGPENDVLKRYVMAAEYVHADIVARVCADNPLVWGRAIDELADFYMSGNYDYAWNHIPRNNLWPDGLGAEMVDVHTLARLDKMAQLPAQREHCFNYIWDNPDQFRMGTFDPFAPELRRPDIKLDVDSPNDFLKLAKLPITPDMDAFDIVGLWPRQ